MADDSLPSRRLRELEFMLAFGDWAGPLPRATWEHYRKQADEIRRSSKQEEVP